MRVRPVRYHKSVSQVGQPLTIRFAQAQQLVSASAQLIVANFNENPNA
jgi:hypothetical protein